MKVQHRKTKVIIDVDEAHFKGVLEPQGIYWPVIEKKEKVKSVESKTNVKSQKMEKTNNV
jgi:hypothetical protein